MVDNEFIETKKIAVDFIWVRLCTMTVVNYSLKSGSTE